MDCKRPCDDSNAREDYLWVTCKFSLDWNRIPVDHTSSYYYYCSLGNTISYTAWGTVFGRNIFAMGSDRDAAYYSGIKTRKNLVLVYTLSGITAAIAGLIMTTRLDAAEAGMGEPFLLQGIAAVSNGGDISIRGWRGNPWKCHWSCYSYSNCQWFKFAGSIFPCSLYCYWGYNSGISYVRFEAKKRDLLEYMRFIN